jgi:hypothetical protein
MLKKIDILGYVIIGLVLVVSIYIYTSSNDFNLKCIVTDEDGKKKFCVRERKNMDAAANLLKDVSEKAQELVDYVFSKFPDMETVQQLKTRFNKDVINEILPTSKYTAYSENKGEAVSFCLNKKKEDNDDLIDEHTLMFVCIHELSHIMTKSIGHNTEFWENFKFLLQQAKDAGIHEPVDYKKEKREYCSMTLKDNPFYDM